MSTISKRLAEYAAGYGSPAFDWERANCCHFAAGWVKACTGRDPMADLPATPRMSDARRLMRALGGLRSACTVQTGLRQVLPTLAQVGDLVLRPLEGDGYALGICAGRTAMHVDELGSVVHLAMDGALCAWRMESAPC